MTFNPQLGLLPFSPRDDESIKTALRNSDVVINLIGKHYETKHIVPTRRADGRLCRVNYDFDEVHAEIPRKIARLAKEAGVSCMIHVSALAADLDSTSKWSRSKAKGELAVREEFPDAVKHFLCDPCSKVNLILYNNFKDYCQACYELWT